MATRWNELTPQTIAGILFIVIGATFISYMLIVIGQKNLRPTVAGMYNYVQPVVACIVAICCGMESLNLPDKGRRSRTDFHRRVPRHRQQKPTGPGES